MKKYWFLPFLFFAALVIFSACKKKDFVNGKDAIDPNEILNGITTDTFDIITYTIAEDSTITSNPANSVLGSYIDPKFGKMQASFYTQFRLGTINPDFGNVNSIKIDSFVLALKYVGYYGDLGAQSFEVLEMDESIYLDSSYYAFSEKTTKNGNLIPIGKRNIVPNPNEKTIVGEDTVDAQLRIQLDTNFAKYLINEAKFGIGFTSNENFLNFFKGIKVKTNNSNQAKGEGGIFYFNLNDPASKATIYFTQDTVSKSFDLLINTSCADFNHVEIENSGYPIENVLSDSTEGLTEFYAQAFKHRAFIKIPGLNELSEKAVIHRADLTLPIQYQTGYRYRPGFSVSAATKLKSTDQSYTNLGILGELNDAKKYFKLNLKNYVQAVVNKNIENNGVVVSPRFFINTAERIVFNGKNTTNKNRPKFILTYTTY
ncbi:MAG: DUF4270 family protein [Bacteroidota bacterium]